MMEYKNNSIELYIYTQPHFLKNVIFSIALMQEILRVSHFLGPQSKSLYLSWPKKTYKGHQII